MLKNEGFATAQKLKLAFFDVGNKDDLNAGFKD